MNELAKADVLDSVLIKGDLSRLEPDERAKYYTAVCHSVGLNPLTRPFEYVSFQGKMTLYARRDAADQLRKINGINIAIVSQTVTDELLTVHVRATDKIGREDEDFGVVAFPSTLRGEARANAVMKAVTKAKRRVTLSISGLGFLDESEVDTVPAMRRPNAPAANPMLALTSHDEDGVVIDSAANSHAPSSVAADTPAPSPNPRQESGAGDYDTEDPRDTFISSSELIILRHTDPVALSKWYNSEEQKKARLDYELTVDQIKYLRNAVMARRNELLKEPAA